MSQLPSPVTPPTENGASGDDAPSFPPELLKCPSLPPELVCRPLAAGDYDRGYIKCLSLLTTTGDVTRQMFVDRFAFLQKHSAIHYSIVIEHTPSDRIVGCASLMLDRKFVHDCGSVAHVEDVVVDDSMRGKNLGKILVETLKTLAKDLGAYKIILNCKESNIGFYQKSGFEQKNVEMSYYFDQAH